MRSALATREEILIIDDHPQNLKLARIVVSGAGFVVRTASDAEEGLHALASFSPRLILLDLQLPGIDGLALTRRLKSDPARRDILVIALTAYAMPGDEERAREAGCDGYLTKPVDIKTLADTIIGFLARPSES
jgi:two-component system, cell cycle response regulator DivK